MKWTFERAKHGERQSEVAIDDKLRARLVAVAHVVVFVGLSGVWMIALGIAVAISLVASGELPTDPNDVMQALGGVRIGLASIGQIVGLVGAAVGLALVLPAPTEPAIAPPPGPAEPGAPSRSWGRLRAAFPLAGSPWLTATGFLGGLCVWTLPSWIAERVTEWLPGFTSTPEMLTEVLLHGTPAERGTIAVAIAVSAPICEELLFRGYLWRVIASGFGTAVAFAATTLLFAAYHLDPVQSLALLPTAVFIGWLRWRSGGLLPSMAAHFANNGLGVFLAFVAPDAEDAAMGPALAVGGAALTLAIAAVGAWLARRSDAGR